MRLIQNAGKVAKHSSTLRLIEVSTAILVLDVGAAAFPFIAESLPISQAHLAGIAAGLNALGWIARFVAQNVISGDKDA